MGNRGAIGGILRREETAKTHGRRRILSFKLQVMKWRWPFLKWRIFLLVIGRKKSENPDRSKSQKGGAPGLKAGAPGCNPNCPIAYGVTVIVIVFDSTVAIVPVSIR